jgi:hypothetical protein
MSASEAKQMNEWALLCGAALVIGRTC